MARTYFITGCSRGIGLELTKQLLDEGEKVIATARHPDKSKGLQELARAYPKTLTLGTLDVVSDKNLNALVQNLMRQRVTVDVLVNNAAVFPEAEKAIEHTSMELMANTYAVNAIAPMRVARALFMLMAKSDFPVVANVSSQIGSLTINHMTTGYGYCMAKAALNMFTKMLSRAHPEITCVSLHPGWVRTDLGGPKAPVELEDSGKGLCKVLRGLKKSDTGKFFEYTGRELTW